eukprot:2465667-Lingulodinium_polyedra.AAC.1
MWDADQEQPDPADGVAADQRDLSTQTKPLSDDCGPKSFEESCSWARSQVRSVLARDPAAADRAKQLMASGVLVISDYSGVGTGEMALAMVFEALKHENIFDADATFKVWHACDSEQSCQL